MSVYFGRECSQTTVSRFENMTLSTQNMVSLRADIEEWLIACEDALLARPSHALGQVPQVSMHAYM